MPIYKPITAEANGGWREPPRNAEDLTKSLAHAEARHTGQGRRSPFR